MFHKHKWKEITRTYKESMVAKAMRINRPISNPRGFCFDDSTQILWECETCQKLRKEEMSGKIID